MQLTERQQHILKTIVELYISTARPVGSSAVVTASGLAVSSATIRNEMVLLEELGYIHQLHTSGGRVPTNWGYRYYVEHLIGKPNLSQSDETTIRHQFHQAHTEMQEWLRLAAAVMANRMRNVGLVTAPRSAEVRLRHLEVIGIQPHVAMLIVVLQDGAVLQEMLPLEDPRTQEELSALAGRLNLLLQGEGPVQIEEKSKTLPAPDSIVADVVAHLLGRADQEHAQVFHAGLADMIRQPEFLGPRPGEPVVSANERLRHMVDFLHHGFAVQRLLAGLPATGEVQIVIGGDTVDPALGDYSFVLGQYGTGDQTSGYLGVVGPTRMEYPRAVALVRYMTGLMTDLMHAY